MGNERVVCARMVLPVNIKGRLSAARRVLFVTSDLYIYLCQEELAKEAETGGGGRGGLVLMGPALIPQELRFLVVYVFSAQGLPSFSSVGIPSVNALVQVRAQNTRRTKKPCEYTKEGIHADVCMYGENVGREGEGDSQQTGRER